MRFRHRDGTTVHLGYCTNVHPAEDLDGILDQLARYAGPLRERLEVPRLGAGLWLARDLAARLVAEPGQLDRLRGALEQHGLEVVTLNGFPYAAFHAPVVKHAVYTPDWASPDRLAYTLDLARVLAALLPADAAGGSISTLPLGWREPWSDERRTAVRAALGDLASGLHQLADETGRRVTVGFEPEPGCLVETTGQAVEHLADVDREVLGVCLDTCHLAVAFEEPVEALARLQAAGLPVVKTQASCALHAPDSGDNDTRLALGRFVEERFLHQVRARASDGVRGVDDLDQALAGGLSAVGPWRVHFHVPVHAPAVPPLSTTQPVLAAALRALLGGERALTPHVEVETYTWDVLPPGSRPHDEDGLVDGLAAELSWTRDRLLEAGLQEVGS